MASLKYSANSQFQAGTLGSSYTSGGGSLSLTSGHGARFPSSGDFWVRVEDEIFKVTARSTDTLTVSGAQDGTSASNHSSGVAVTWVLAVSSLDQLRTDVGSLYTTYASVVSTAPGSNEVGKLAYCSDSIYTARWNGTSWQWFLHGISATPPQVTGQTTVLSAGINNSVTSLVVTGQFASMPSTPFFIMIGTEQLKVTVASTTTWTVTRGDGGTTAASHSTSDVITEMLYSWSDFNSGSSYNNTGGVLTVENNASIGSNDGGTKMKVKLAYSAPWTVIAAVGMFRPFPVNNIGAGFALWDVALPAQDVRVYSSQYANGWFGHHSIFSWAGGASFSAAISGGTANSPYGSTSAIAIPAPYNTSSPLWYKWVDNSTNWICYTSEDKVDWREVGRVARNTTLTATHAGPFISARGTRAGVTLLSLEQFNSVV